MLLIINKLLYLTRRERGRVRENLPFSDLLRQSPQQLGWFRLKPTAWNSTFIPHVSGMYSSTCYIIRCTLVEKWKLNPATLVSNVVL